MRRRTFLAVAGVTAAALAVPAQASATGHPFRNPGLPLRSRVEDLLTRLTLPEKVSLLHQYQPAIPRLGMAMFKTGTEALHGVAWSTDITSTPDPGAVRTAVATVFPQAVGLASTWDPALIRRVGSVVGDEIRGYHSDNPVVWGLNAWAPVVNLLRDPRWGRNEEGYSEDAYLTGVIATAYAGGMAGDDPRHLKTAPTLKHYLANNNEIRRDRTSSNLPPRVRKEYYEVPFRAPIAAGAATGVMAAYNLVNGRPATVLPDFDDVVRTWTDQVLMNVTDAGNPNNLIGSQAYFDTLAQADAATLKAGLDSFTVDNTNAGPTIDAVNAALAQGLLAESDVDSAVRHILTIRFRLGEFDPGGGPYGGITMDVVNSPAHRRLARETAGRAVVLLKNDGALPLRPAGTVAVVGPLADTLYTDWYSGRLPYVVTPRAGIAERVTVTGGEAVDRIALRTTDGRYVTASTAADGAPLTVGGSAAGEAQRFDVFDWGQGVVTLRSVANGKYVERDGFGATSGFVNRAPQPRDWFVHQQFTFEDAGGGTVVVRYVGYETVNDWEGPNNYLTVAPDGGLLLGSPDAAGATPFVKETISSGIAEAVAAAEGADAAVVVVGSMPFINGREDHDRTTMALAESQSALVRAVHAANPNTVVVVENSYPTTLTWEQDNVPAILWTTHAGQETGHAVADVLFGDVNPAGRLTQTWYRRDADLPDILEYDIIKARRTYQYFEGDPLYPFGHGLSYSTFRYGGPGVASQGPLTTESALEVSVPVTNTSDRAGDEVVQLYTHQRESRDPRPDRTLRAFQRVHLLPGQTRTVRFSVPVRDLAHWDVTRGRWVVEGGTYDVLVGASCADIRQRGSVRVRGETIPARNLSRTTRAVDFDDYADVSLVDTSKARGDSVGGPGWVSFHDSELRRARSFTARVAGAGTIEVRLGGPAGRLLGTATSPGTADKYTYTSVAAALTGADGRHDVYLVLTGELRVDTFTIR
ncbi:glycoside hydrolase family 3 protein [Actinophytocola glycyrrhizae]|uniref:Glycoside hydrolase family 3 C-terminal domain-containing protein n=1 Tax=Actinophytocola glycyrrhizae TaxID=2044873 RepID=A0ABV9S692_9PSEU